MRNRLNIQRVRQDGVAIAAFALLVVSFIFGGASRQHELRLALVELAALPLLVIGLIALSKREDLSRHKFAFGLTAAVAALPIIQLIPLPPGIWTGLPGRDQLALALEISGIQPGWLPLSLTPDRTWRSFLALTPPLAMFVGLLATRSETRLRLIYGILIGTLLCILLGAVQLASGSDRFYPWMTTNAGNVTGLFANRNHLATLCLVSIPFATVIGAAVLKRRSSRLPLWIATLYIALVAIALGVIRSRTGVILFGPVLGMSLIAAWVAAGRGRPSPLLLGFITAAALAVAAVGAYAAAPLLQRFDPSGAPEGRFENWPIVMQAAATYMPLGSGFGSFDTVYRSVEPLEQLDPTFFNQAHNDYLETLLEAGWLGIALMSGFFVWFARRAWTAWRASVSTQRDLQRAASIAIGAILIHSAADYPLRTAALATIFALCCGLLELAPRTDAELSPERARSRRQG